MLSRRSFLTSTLGAAAGLTMQGPRQAAAQTPVAQTGRRRRTVDAQVHLWKAETPDRPWVPGMVPQLPEPFTMEKLLPMMDEAGVDRVVIVPPSWEGDRVDYAIEAARRYPDRFAVMGRILLKNPQSADLLPRWKDQPGMLGLRVTFLGAQAAWLTDGTADWFWPAAERAGLPVMFLTNGKLPEFVRIAERHPRLALIVDHMGLTVDIACGLAAALGLVAPLGPGVSIDVFGQLLVAAHLACLLALLTGTVGRWWRNRRLLHGGR